MAMDHEGYKNAAEYWKNKDAQSVKMPREELLPAAEKYINENNTCALATAADGFVRCTPIEYTYHDGAFWMFSEGGLKFAALDKNKNVCIAIFDKFGSFAGLKGMQVTGTADVVEPFSKEYDKAAEYRKIPLDALKKLPRPMNLIKIIPTEIEFLNSDFKKQGYDVRQKLVF